MGAVTISQTLFGVSGNRRWTRGTVTMSASYATNGDTYAVSDLGGSIVLDMILTTRNPHYSAQVDIANGKIKVFESVVITGSTAIADVAYGSLAENAAGAETTVRLMGASPDVTHRIGTQAEVANTTDLSAIVFDYEVTVLP